MFYGENLGLKNFFRQKIKKHYAKIKIVDRNQDEILKNKNLFMSEIFNISLFGEKKIFFVNQVTDKILDLINEIEAKLDDQKIFLFSDLLDKKSKIRNYFEKSKKIAIIPCYADNEADIKRIILTKLNGFQGLTSNIINLIIENCNLNRVKLENELSKILIFFEKKSIDEKQLIKLLNLKTNDNFNKLRDEALNGNKISLNKSISETILEPEKNIFYLNSINQRLIKLKEIQEIAKTSNIEKAIDQIKPPIFWKEKASFLIQTKIWDRKKIQKILTKTYNLEIFLKSNSFVNHSVLLKKLILDMCDLAST